VTPPPVGRLLQQVGELSRESARDAAVDELSKRPYVEAQPPVLLRLVGRVLREIGELFGRAADAAPGGSLGLLLLAAVLGLLVAVLVVRVRPGRGARAQEALFEQGRPLTAAGHRELAEQAAAQGRWADAVRERLRAVVRELEARGVLDPRPGRTAGEVAREAGAVVPAVAADLERGVQVFGEIWYGGRPADPASYAALVDVDRRVSERRLAVR
jgi:hypothetical protein